MTTLQGIENNTGIAQWDQLEDKLLLKVFGDLSPDDLCRCARVNKQWKRVSENESLWQPWNQLLAEKGFKTPENLSGKKRCWVGAAKVAMTMAVCMKHPKVLIGFHVDRELKEFLDKGPISDDVAQLELPKQGWAGLFLTSLFEEVLAVNREKKGNLSEALSIVWKREDDRLLDSLESLVLKRIQAQLGHYLESDMYM